MSTAVAAPLAPPVFTEAVVRDRAAIAGINPDQAVRVARAEGIIPSKVSLYDLETGLQALLDTEDLVQPEQEEEFRQELQATLVAAVEKRDRVGQFMLHLKSQIAFAHSEIQRLRDREAFYGRVLERMEGYITDVVDNLGVDAKGKRKKLAGNTITLSLHGCDKRVEVFDEASVPTKYKRITVTLPAETWETVCDSLDLEFREQVLGEVRSPSVEVSSSLVKADLKALVDVPGARLAGGTYVEIK